MFAIDGHTLKLEGPKGALAVREDDEITRKLAMLYEGECELGPGAAARKFGYTRQRYFQLRRVFAEEGALGLLSHKRGPKSPSRRTVEVERQIIRHRFLDPDASAAVIARKIQQGGRPISRRSVERVVAAYGLQKKTLPVPPRR